MTKSEQFRDDWRRGHALAPAPRGLRRLATAALPYTWAIVVANYAVIVLVILAVFPRLPLVLFG